MSGKRKVLGVHLGDANGIGPELVAKIASENKLTKDCDVVMVSSKDTWLEGLRRANVSVDYDTINDIKDYKANKPITLLDTDNLIVSEMTIGECSSIAGKSCGDNLMKILELSKEGYIDGFIFAPFNKTSLKMGGYSFESENKLFAHYFNVTNHVCELNISSNIWTSRVTSHVPIKDIASSLNVDNIYGAIELIDKALKNAGYENPRIGVSALNPHAGEGGTCGREEIDIIAPAIKKAVDSGINVAGPISADIIFIKALKNNEYDAVVTMYHDQGQIALKVFDFESGVTYHGGLPVVITTPAHGSAFDIAGKGIAATRAIENALSIAVSTITNK